MRSGILSWLGVYGLLTLAVGWAGGSCAAEQYELTERGWQQVAAPDPGSPEGKLQQARKLLAEERFKQAHAAADAWIEENPDSTLMPEALLVRADALVGRGDYWNALYDYEAIILDWPSSEAYLTAVQREYQIAKVFIGGWKRKFLGLAILPTDGEGEELLIRVQERAPGTVVGEQASIDLADYYFRQAEMQLAADAYDLFLENYPNSPRREWAMLRLIQANLARFKGPAFDGTGLIEADERLAQYEAEFPATAERIGATALRVRIRESLAKRDLLSGQWYKTRSDNVAAASVYRRLVNDYPDTAAAREAVQRLDAMGTPVQP
jgi:outer membrane protein assembly factor BamD